MIVEGLVEKGFAVYRMEKPGMGDSNNSDQCADIGYHDELEAFRNGLNTLKMNEDVDGENIVLFGISTGGVTASAIAADSKVKGMVKYGSLFHSMYNTVLKETKDQAVLRGHSQKEIAADIASRQPMLHAYFIDKKHPEELAKNPEWDRLMRSGWPFWDGRYCLNRDPTFAREINDINIEETLKKAKCPVLAIHGEFDYNIPNNEWAEKTAETVNSVLPGKGKFVLLEGTEHGFTKVSSMEENIRLMDNRGFTAEFREANFNHKLVEIIAEWISEVTT
jgi:pimeloyl-ACP methyl ester carboxylesterase